jgi:hypothetical protein
LSAPSSKAEGEALLAQALAKLLKALARGSKAAQFNLACLEAIHGDLDACISWLRSAVESGERITQENLRAESDFDSVREHPDFVQFQSSLPEV